ncbi:protein of unknown function [Cupriavidus taiwanensis]|uniref:Uncharacterized protein n=1 Tax=Cupriavidus taiwanensis TaxID=164546 RepID=A0A7Z7NMR6_9BURK|nr:protein of unknown function [Cupriavidus taiwanensis]SOZ42254.1 protein of unknown function [Cupriavidus taiwanensis]SPC21293.1 protein of unknown function [Cupriavidus taiwanensis]
MLVRVKQRKLFRERERAATDWPNGYANFIDGHLNFLAFGEMCRTSHRSRDPDRQAVAPFLNRQSRTLPHDQPHQCRYEYKHRQSLFQHVSTSAPCCDRTRPNISQPGSRQRQAKKGRSKQPAQRTPQDQPQVSI